MVYCVIARPLGTIDHDLHARDIHDMVDYQSMPCASICGTDDEYLLEQCRYACIGKKTLFA